MPTYAYRCKSCSYEFDEFQKISDERLTKCPSCDQETLIRLIGGGAGLVFKGSGFYLTDYKKTGSGGGSSSGESKKESKSDAKAESKPESKSDSKSAEKSSSTPAASNSSSSKSE